MAATPKTIKELHHYLRNELRTLHPPEEADAMGYLIIEHTCSLSRIEFLRSPSLPVTPGSWSKVKDILGELKHRRPLQYIIGHTTFYDHKIRLNPHVLIPRPETEELVHWFLQVVNTPAAPLNILDTGTGSGCIAIALAARIPQVKIFACDVSEKALVTARQNARANNVSITFFQMDIQNPDKTFDPGFFNHIISNPPYIPISDKAALQPEVSRYEPAKALFVPEDDPLIFYRAILNFSSEALHPDGMLFFEVHERFSGSVAELCRHTGFPDTVIRKDLNGKERMIRARRKS
ncbi:MAG: peptide chain release factor N(5)-glutamine methyltransferase [Chlorobi bacterium]|nr:peptide chain release factor N(5)-glutamine methyltransferase [Chlorobiota bacterium]